MYTLHVITINGTVKFYIFKLNDLAAWASSTLPACQDWRLLQYVDNLQKALRDQKYCIKCRQNVTASRKWHATCIRHASTGYVVHVCIVAKSCLFWHLVKATNYFVIGNFSGNEHHLHVNVTLSKPRILTRTSKSWYKKLLY